MRAAADAAPGEREAYRKVSRRLIPLLVLCYLAAFLARVNVGFAALQMNDDLGFGPVVYGWGAGVFFLGYAGFGVPSNVILHRMGTRRWISCLMLAWGLLSMSMALVRGPTQFWVLRFLLGVAEAGFYPGIVLYLTYWFPAARRAKVMGLFTLANPISIVVGAPLSGALLVLDGLCGLRGWEWLFLVEGLPTLVLGGLVLRFLSDRPAEAGWLTPAEQRTIEQRIAEDERRLELNGEVPLRRAFSDPRVLVLGLVYFGVSAANYGLSFWLPQIVKAFGVTNLQAGLVSALPYACGAAGMVAWAAHSDRTGERTWHVALPLLVTGLCLVAASALSSFTLTMLLLCVAGWGVFAALPTYWTLPTSFMTGGAAAGSIALINSIGNLSGLVAPYTIGWIMGATGKFSSALLALAAMPLGAMVLTLWLQRGQLRRATPG